MDAAVAPEPAHVRGLEPEVCWQAVHSRDARFDGRFFAGVVTTRVYCRSVCPVPFAKPNNVLWFASAAAAERAGFHPCRRCRSAASPGTPAWLGTSAVVSRALRLIAEGALDSGNIEELAGRVGLGSRHLRRLFIEHLGASPIRIASTRRAHFARSLIEETDLPITELAAYAIPQHPPIQSRHARHHRRVAHRTAPAAERLPGFHAAARPAGPVGVSALRSTGPERSLFWPRAPSPELSPSSAALIAGPSKSKERRARSRFVRIPPIANFW